MPGALSSLRVLELGQLIAGPFAGAYLASFGAEVIKVEPPGKGDPLRKWRMLHQGTSLWWRLMARNKKSVAIDLRTPAGRDIVRSLIESGTVDIVIENFRPGRMEAWGLDYDSLSEANPRLIMARISGYGQTGPKAQQPGFANIAEATGGIRYLSAEPGRAPVRTGVSLGDSVAGMQAALGILTAVIERDLGGSGRGQVVDVALQEAVFGLLESALPEFDLFGHVREPSGSGLSGIAPTNSYACKDGLVVIGANSDAMFRRLMQAIGRLDLRDDSELAQNDGRVARAEELDAAISGYCATRGRSEVLGALEAAEVACGPVQSIADIARDPQFLARGVFEAAQLGETRVLMPRPMPVLHRTPGQTRWLGPELGEHTREVLEDHAGLDAARIGELLAASIVETPKSREQPPG